MKKTVALIIALCLVVLACVPSIPAKASSGDSGYVLYLGNSGNNYTGDFKTVADAIYSYGGSPTSITNTKNFLDNQFGNSDYFIESQGGGFDGSVSDCFAVVVNGGTDLRLIAFSVRYDSCEGLYIVSSTPFTLDTYSINTSSYTKTLRSSYSSAHISYNGQDVYACVQINSSSYIGNFGLSGMTITDNSNSSFGLGSLSNVYLRYSSIPLYSAYEDSQFNFQNTFMQFGTSYKALFSDELATCINEKVNAFTVDGVVNGFETGVLPPSDPEVNTALAFDNFDSQVVYNPYNKTFTSANLKWDLNPMGRSIIESYDVDDWQMKYVCQVTYNMSSYRPNNQITPLQSYANGFTFTGSVWFDDYDSIMDGSLYGLDPIKGFENLSDTEITSAVNSDCNLFFALLGAMKGNYASGNSFTSGKSGFNLVGGTIISFIAGNYTSVGGLAGAFAHVEGATGVNAREWLEDHISGDYVYMIDNFTMNVRAWFECGSVKSNYGDTDIDYLNHTTSSYAPRAYETQEGVDPTIPEPYTNTNDTPVEPGGLDANGVIVYVPVNVEVNVPSGGGDNTVTSGDNSIINNNNPTFSPVFNNNNENSVESLSDLIGEDAATANNGIGGFLDPFKNNSMVTLTGEYFGIVPEGLRTVLIAAVGILIILGIYRFIRRG